MKNIDLICERYKIKNYIINKDGSIDVNGDVSLSWCDLYELPLKFNKVTGYFSCVGNYLTSLKGSPKYVGEDFYCSDNNLTSLKESPEYVGGHFFCLDNKIENLEGIGQVGYLRSEILEGNMDDINKHLLDIKLKRLIEL